MAVPFTISRMWDQLKCPSADKRVKMECKCDSALKKVQGESTACDNMNEPQDIMLSEINQSLKEHFPDSTYLLRNSKIAKFTESKSGMVVTRG